MDKHLRKVSSQHHLPSEQIIKRLERELKIQVDKAFKINTCSTRLFILKFASVSYCSSHVGRSLGCIDCFERILLRGF